MAKANERKAIRDVVEKVPAVSFSQAGEAASLFQAVVRQSRLQDALMPQNLHIGALTSLYGATVLIQASEESDDERIVLRVVCLTPGAKVLQSFFKMLQDILAPRVVGGNADQLRDEAAVAEHAGPLLEVQSWLAVGLGQALEGLPKALKAVDPAKAQQRAQDAVQQVGEQLLEIDFAAVSYPEPSADEKPLAKAEFDLACAVKARLVSTNRSLNGEALIADAFVAGIVTGFFKP